MKNKLILLSLFCLFLIGCNGWTIKTHRGFFSADVYELTNGDISIKYYNGDCCCIAKDVLTEMKNRIENGTLDANKFIDKKYVDEYLRKLCNELRNKFDKEQ